MLVPTKVVHDLIVAVVKTQSCAGDNKCVAPVNTLTVIGHTVTYFCREHSQFEEKAK